MIAPNRLKLLFFAALALLIGYLYYGYEIFAWDPFVGKFHFISSELYHNFFSKPLPATSIYLSISVFRLMYVCIYAGCSVICIGLVPLLREYQKYAAMVFGSGILAYIILYILRFLLPEVYFTPDILRLIKVFRTALDSVLYPPILDFGLLIVFYYLSQERQSRPTNQPDS